MCFDCPCRLPDHLVGQSERRRRANQCRRRPKARHNLQREAQTSLRSEKETGHQQGSLTASASSRAGKRTGTRRKRRREPLCHEYRMGDRLCVDAKVDKGYVEGVLLVERGRASAQHLIRKAAQTPSSEASEGACRTILSKFVSTSPSKTGLALDRLVASTSVSAPTSKCVRFVLRSR